MQIHKTHILIRENKMTGMGGQPLEPFVVYECRIPGANLAQVSKSIYFRELKSGFGNSTLEILSEEKFTELETKTEEVLHKL